MTKERIGLIMIGLVGLALVGSGIGKIVGAEEAAVAFGGPTRPYVLAIVEFLIVGALAIPRTRLLGCLLAASYFGGAIAFSWLAVNEVPIASLAINTILYVGAALYRPWLTENAVPA